MVSSREAEVAVVRHVQSDSYWPINWSSIWVGTLAALALALVFSLVGAALGAHQLGLSGRIAKWNDVGFAALAFAVCGAFFSFVVGGWVAGKINGYRKAETRTCCTAQLCGSLPSQSWSRSPLSAAPRSLVSGSAVWD